MNEQKKALLVRYFTILTTIVFGFCVLLSALTMAYILIKPAQKHIPPSVDIITKESIDNAPTLAADDTNTNEGILENLFKAPTRTNFVLMGVDQTETLADVVMAGCFNSETGKISLISIPRDTYVKLTPERIKELNDAGRNNIPSNGVMKMNEVHSYAGKKLGAEYIQKQVEDILCVKIDFNVEINLAAFRKIVDGIGGVRMDIPEGGLFYEDPAQDLLIDIPGGSQMLFGKDAEGLVRFREGYARADLQRIEVQQKFIKELMKQALDRENIVKNAPALISAYVSYVKTTFPISDLPKYFEFIDDFSAGNIDMYTLPGSAENSAYYNPDTEAVAKLVEEIFYTDVSQTANEDTNIETTDRVQVLNGGIISGLAASKKRMLEDKGYEVLAVGDYTGEQQEYTRIVAKNEKTAKKYFEYFYNAKYINDSTMLKDYDVVVILGTGER